MSLSGVEFSRRVPLARIGRERFHQEIAARPEEREALARRFGLLALDRLTATVELCRADAETIVLEAEFEAAFVQECVVSLEPVTGTIAERFALRYGRVGANEVEIAFTEDEGAFEPLEGDAIDIGEAVAQELSLALPPFPRDPNVVLDPAPADPQAHPFSALGRRNKSAGR